ncbi:MAG: DUF4245 family protein [Propionibacteriales bacterium]|nr:DUF4245 family protein [Propionibacteriales bacterium]
MSQPEPNPHTQRSVAGMIGSMVVVVVVVVGWVGFRSFISDPPSPPPRVVDWTVAVGVGDRADALALYAPKVLPLGWSAKDARYSGGRFPRWELALRTDNVRTVSLAEALSSGRTLVEGIDEDATEGADVTLGGVVWQSWKFSGGDYGISREVDAPTGGSEAVLVHGSGSQAQIHDFAQTLEPRNPAPTTP